MLFKLFNSAGATGHVFYLKNGRVHDKGLAYGGIIGPLVTVAVVPTTPQILDFTIEAKTKDKQDTMVPVSLTATLVPAIAVAKFDFTVDARRGGYIGNWLPAVKARVLERTLRAVLEKVQELEVEVATRSQKDIENAVMQAIENDAFKDDGIKIISCSIPKVEPSDDEVANSLGAKERQVMLTAADFATHERRLKSVENDRAIKAYEADTKLELEKKQKELLQAQAENEKTKANTDAEATRIRLGPLAEVEAGKLLGAALMEGFKTGRIGSIVVAPELLGALQKQ